MDSRDQRTVRGATAEPYLIPQLVPGENHKDEIERATAGQGQSLDDLAERCSDERHAELTAEIRRLAREDQDHPNPDEVKWVDSGKTHGEVWRGSTTAERRDMLKDAGFKVIWHGDGKWSIQPGSIARELRRYGV